MWSDNETALDSLNVQHLVQAMLTLLDLPDLSPVTIGVYGDWGSGKSSVVLMLKGELEKPPRKVDTLCVVFNGWRFDGYDDAKSALMTTILEQLATRETVGSTAHNAILKLVKRVNWLRVGKTVGRYALHAGMAVATGGASAMPSLAAEAAIAASATSADDIVQSADAYFTGAEEAKKVHDTVRDFEADFSRILEQTDLKRLVVIIDDLDRCNPHQVIETLEAIRLFLAVPKTAFIIAADELMVQSAARQRFPGLDLHRDSLGRDYLEKMVQIPLRVAPLSPRDIETYLNMLFLQLHLPGRDFAAACSRLLAAAQADAEFRVTAASAHEIVGGPLTDPMKVDLALAEQVRPVVALSVDGNPRQIKRFLNAFRLRMILAEARHVKLDPRVTAKLMLLEYFRIEAFRVVARWQASQGGIASELSALELAVAGEEQSALSAPIPPVARTTPPRGRVSQRPATESKPPHGGERVAGVGGEEAGSGIPPEAVSWGRDTWMAAWLGAEPKLGAVDLAPYFYFARDRLAGQSPSQRMSQAAREALALLLTPSSAVQDSAKTPLLLLSGPDAVAILQALADRIRASDTTAEASIPFRGALILVAARNELVTEFASILRSLPLSRFSPGTPNRLLAAMRTMGAREKETIEGVIREWETQTVNAPLAGAARLAMGQAQA